MRVGVRRRAAGRGLASSQTRFARRASSRRRHPWRRALGLAVVAAVVGGLVWLVGWSTALAVDEVRVTGAADASVQSVLDRAAVVVGTPLLRVDTDAVARRVRGDITVAEVSVRRSWPGTVVVEVVHREPAIVVRTPRGRLEVVDVDGVAFGTVTSAPAGVPTVSATAEAGMTPAALQAALTLLDALPADLAREVTAITVSSADLVTFRLGARTVVWGGGEESGRKVAILQALLPTKSAVIDVSAPDTPVTR
ncbi:MAG: cell division protein FtsQ/DivIB [Dermatophilaceae bacterium]